MRYFFFLLFPLLGACTKGEKQEPALVHSERDVHTFKRARLDADHILVLEIHYPLLLQKIALLSSLNVNDVITLHEVGVKRDSLIHIIKYTGSNFVLTTDDIVKLQLGGVPISVINLMIET